MTDYYSGFLAGKQACTNYIQQHKKVPSPNYQGHVSPPVGTQSPTDWTNGFLGGWYACVGAANKQTAKSPSKTPKPLKKSSGPGPEDTSFPWKAIGVGVGVSSLVAGVMYAIGGKPSVPTLEDAKKGLGFNAVHHDTNQAQ